MKVKKLLALLLSAVMAVSMLTACGGGGGGGTGGKNSSNVLDYDVINTIISNAGYNVKVGELSTMTRDAEKAAKLLTKYNASDVSNKDAYIESMSVFSRTPGALLVTQFPKSSLGNTTYEQYVAKNIIDHIKSNGASAADAVAVEFMSKDNILCYIIAMSVQ